jgi:hypothetical protein
VAALLYGIMNCIYMNLFSALELYRERIYDEGIWVLLYAEKQQKGRTMERRIKLRESVRIFHNLWHPRP